MTRTSLVDYLRLRASVTRHWNAWLLALAFFLGACHAPSQLPKIFALPPAALVDDNSRPVQLDQMHGHVTIYDFIYTHCAGTCPMMTTSLAQVVHKVHDPNVRFASISVDPKRDTPAVLRDYARRAGSDPRWLFLTGEPQVITNLSEKGFKLAAVTAQASPTEDLLHSSRFALADKTGTIRGYYDGLDQKEIDRLVRDIEDLSRD